MELVKFSKSKFIFTENILTNAVIYLLISHSPIFFTYCYILFFYKGITFLRITVGSLECKNF